MFYDDDIADTGHLHSDTGDGGSGRAGVDREFQTKGVPPALFHRVRNERSILAVVVSDHKIYAGTQGGEILVGRHF